MVDDVIIHAPTRQSATKTTTVVVVQNDEDDDDGRRPSIFAPRPNAISPSRTCTDHRPSRGLSAPTTGSTKNPKNRSLSVLGCAAPEANENLVNNLKRCGLKPIGGSKERNAGSAEATAQERSVLGGTIGFLSPTTATLSKDN
jgi:hypothetical protein